jgi:fructan beta-fructosidase
MSPAGCCARWFGLSATRRRVGLAVTLTLVVACALAPAAGAQEPTYREPYRPQFHFTPAKNWMNDPNGMVYYQGEYHLFFQHNPFGDQWGHISWGHAVSRDLVHWEQLGVAIPEDEARHELIFSGSAVVDELNTSGFGTPGNPPMVAIYTSAVPDDQEQSLAYSTDRGRTWTKYAGNPVLDIDDREFRDPKVFWYAPEQKWVMVVVKAVQHKVAIYSSRNLKDWEHLSDFGPANAVGGVWECPDLFPLAVEGDPLRKKWVMVVSLNPGGIAGGSGSQYFVGDFDGTTFTADNVQGDYSPPAGDVYEGFEHPDWGPWTTTGTAFGDGPAPGNVPPQGGVSGYMGERLANSFHEEDRGTGTLTSSEFTVSRPYLNFLVGGGNHPHDPATVEGPPPSGPVFADFEGDTYGAGWTATGTFAGTRPPAGTIGDQQPVSGYEGHQLVNTFIDHDNGTGHITSPEFTVTSDYINFLVGGGFHPYPGSAGNPSTAVDLIVDGTVVRTATGQDSEALNWTNWNVAEFRGRTARIDIVDENTGGFGHILADQFMFSNQPAFPRSTETAVNLIVDDEVVRSATGKDSEHLDWNGWNVHDLVGKTARIQLVDNNTGGWGHLLADHFMFADAKAQSVEERSSWLDYGKDYYAAVSWNNVPDGRRLMIGWMSNWQYAGQIPTSPWRSAMSVPRELALRTFDGRPEVVQEPVQQLREQRNGPAYQLERESVQSSARTLESCHGTTLEIDARLTVSDAQKAGLVVRAGGAEQTLIGYDAQAGELYVDRTRSGDTSFSRSFPAVQRAPLSARDGVVRLHVLVDWSSVEVFADGGRRVITSQIFPAATSDGVQIFAAGGTARFDSIQIWPLRSIWPNAAPAGPCNAAPAQNAPGQGNPQPGQPRARARARVTGVRVSTRCYRNASLDEPPARGRRAMRFSYRLTAAAAVRLTVRRRNGSPKWTSCPARRGKTPFPYTDVGSRTENGKAGENQTQIGSAARIRAARRLQLVRKHRHTHGKVTLARLLAGKRLLPGTYVLAVAALDEAGRPTSERHVKFWVFSPKQR